MNSIESGIQQQVADMRRFFDGSFAAPEQSGKLLVEHMLAIRVRGEHFAVRLSELSGLTVVKGTILPLPSSVPELLGITGIHGAVVPVFDLAALLGIGPGSKQCRWLILCGTREATVAFAVELVQNHMEVAADQVLARENDTLANHVRQTVRDGAMLRGLIDLSLLVKQIRTKGAASPTH